MISIRDEDKARLEKIVDLLGNNKSGSRLPLFEARTEAQAILKSIHDLSQEQPYPAPRIGPLTNEQKVCLARPGAREISGRHGSVWIVDAHDIALSDHMDMGSLNDRRGDAWDDAARRLGL